VIHNTIQTTLGADLRALRKARGLTLVDLAETLDRSVGWMSQVERNKSEPALDDLRKLARALDVSVSSLFRVKTTEPSEAGIVVRSGARRPIGSREAGLVEELLSPDLTDDFEMVHSTFEAGAVMDVPISRPTQEVAYIVSGKFHLWVGDKMFELSKGDSVRIRGEAYRWANPFSEPCIAIWVIAPPVY
jgi:transcriptional regulator with XRE-family HTH domain